VYTRKIKKKIKGILEKYNIRNILIYCVVIGAYFLSIWLNENNLGINLEIEVSLTLALLSAYTILYSFLYSELNKDEKKYYWGVDIVRFQLSDYLSMQLLFNKSFQFGLVFVFLFPFIQSLVQGTIYHTPILNSNIDFYGVQTAWAILFLFFTFILISSLIVRVRLVNRRNFTETDQRRIKDFVREESERLFKEDIDNEGIYCEFPKDIKERLNINIEQSTEMILEGLIPLIRGYSKDLESLNRNTEKLNELKNKSANTEKKGKRILKYICIFLSFLYKTISLIYYTAKSRFFKKEYSCFFFKKQREFFEKDSWEKIVWKKELAFKRVYLELVKVLELLKGEKKWFRLLDLKNEILSAHHKIYWYQSTDTFRLDRKKDLEHYFFTPKLFWESIADWTSLLRVEEFIGDSLKATHIEKDGYLFGEFFYNYMKKWFEFEKDIKNKRAPFRFSDFDEKEKEEIRCSLIGLKEPEELMSKFKKYIEMEDIKDEHE